jgi:hypothetical protein
MNIFERGLCVLQCRVSLSPNFQMLLVLTAAVCSLSNILCPFHANRSISSGRPYWPTTGGISWPNDVHASYVRPV